MAVVKSVEGDSKFAGSVSNSPSGLKVCLSPEKTEKLHEMFQEIRQFRNLIPARTLHTAAGVLGWISNLIPTARPWASMLWAAVYASESSRSPAKLSTRVRKGFSFKRQVEHALHWLEGMLSAKTGTGPKLEHAYRWSERIPVLEPLTDACPSGVGGVLYAALKPIAYFSHQFSQEDCKLLGTSIGDPVFQSEYELYAILVAVLLFKDFFSQGRSKFLSRSKAQVFLRIDNTSAVLASTEYRTKSPILTYLAAELAVQVEGFGMCPIKGRRIMGVLNTVADPLSRDVVPAELAHVERFYVTESIRASCKVLPKRCY